MNNINSEWSLVPDNSLPRFVYSKHLFLGRILHVRPMFIFCNITDFFLPISLLYVGQYLVGYLQSGDIFIWNKEQDTLRTVKGPPSISASTQQGSQTGILFYSTQWLLHLAPNSQMVLSVLSNMQGCQFSGKSLNSGPGNLFSGHTCMFHFCVYKLNNYR